MLINYSWPLAAAPKVRSNARTAALGGGLSADSQLQIKASLMRICSVLWIWEEKNEFIKVEIIPVIK